MTGQVGVVRAALLRAARVGDVEVVRSMLRDGANVDGWVRSGGTLATPLMAAARSGYADVATLLLDAGTSIEARSLHGWSALTIADAEGHDDVVGLLLDRGADAALRLAHGYGPWHRAVVAGAVRASAGALDRGPINRFDAQGETALHLAIGLGDRDSVISLLALGASPDANGSGWSPLCDAVHADSVAPEGDFVSLLFDAGVNPRPAGYPPILLACNQDGSRPALLATLVAYGVDRDAVDDHGDSLLYLVAEINGAEELDAALALGIALEARNHDGRTPLLNAARNGNQKTFVRLLERGADHRSVDDQGHGVVDLLDDRDHSAPIIRSAFDLRSYRG